MKKFKNEKEWKVVSSISYEPIEEPEIINYPKPKMSMLQKLMIQQLIKDESSINS